MDIYVKPKKKVSAADKHEIMVGDVADVIATADVQKKAEDLIVMHIDCEHKHNYLVSVTDIIRTLKKKFPDYSIVNVGEIDTVVECRAHKSKDNPLWKWTKIAFVCLVLMAGSSTAIMSFHSDAQMPEVFKNYYKIFFGKETEKPMIIDIPYSIGLAVGIVVFFNHFMGKKITDDPTPIEVEMATYNEDITKTVIASFEDQTPITDNDAANTDSKSMGSDGIKGMDNIPKDGPKGE